MSPDDLTTADIPGRRVSLTVVAIVCSLFVFVLARGVEPMTSGHPAFEAGGDHLLYLAMAEEPGGLYQAPFCYRVLMPALARLMPFGTADSFYFLTVIFLVGTGVLLYYIVLETSGDRLLALAGISLFYSLSAGAKFCLYDFWLTEPALFFFSALSVLALLKGHDIWLSISLALAVLAKESALFIIPAVYAVTARSLLDRRAALRALSVAVLPVAAYAAVRIAVPTLQEASPAGLFRSIGLERLTAGLAGLVRGGTVGTWGILIPVLLAASGRRGGRILLRALPFIVLVYAQPLFAKNVDRLLVLAFLAFIPAAAEGLRAVRERFSLERWMTGGAVLIPFILTAIKKGYNSPSAEQQLGVLAGWAAVVAVSIAARKRKTGRGPGGPIPSS